jgi:hypothetical protein
VKKAAKLIFEFHMMLSFNIMMLMEVTEYGNYDECSNVTHLRCCRVIQTLAGHQVAMRDIGQQSRVVPIETGALGETIKCPRFLVQFAVVDTWFYQTWEFFSGTELARM